MESKSERSQKKVKYEPNRKISKIQNQLKNHKLVSEAQKKYPFTLIWTSYPVAPIHRIPFPILEQRLLSNDRDTKHRPVEDPVAYPNDSNLKNNHFWMRKIQKILTHRYLSDWQSQSVE
jgi:hypothetical protein